MLAPREYASAIVLVDSLAWGGAREDVLHLAEAVGASDQLLLRACLFRPVAAVRAHRERATDPRRDLEAPRRAARVVRRRLGGAG